MRKAGIRVLVAVLCSVWGWAQQADIAAKLAAYPQTIFYNGKIVSMSDASFNSEVGAIFQAMAIRDGKILATGTSADMRALAGPQTKQIDLKGREVLPSFIMTHEHPTDWAFIEPRGFRHVLPNDDVIVSRWMPSLPAKEQMARFEATVKEAVSKAKPGQWIRVIFNWGPNYEWATDVLDLYGKSIKKEYLDLLAPNNPIIVKDGFIGETANALAIAEFRSVHPPAATAQGGGGGGVQRTGERRAADEPRHVSRRSGHRAQRDLVGAVGRDGRGDDGPGPSPARPGDLVPGPRPHERRAGAGQGAAR